MISDAAFALILAAEDFRGVPYWPGNPDSGVTWGWGYDAGYVPPDRLIKDWTDYITPGKLYALAACCGVRGMAAGKLADTFTAPVVDEESATNQFIARALPIYEAQTEHAFPGCRELPPDAYGALVSLVYNRGPALTGKRRDEMRAIRAVLADGVQAGDLAAIAQQIRAMKRLWEKAGLPGLLKRREAEARLVEQAIP